MQSAGLWIQMLMAEVPSGEKFYWNFQILPSCVNISKKLQILLSSVMSVSCKTQTVTKYTCLLVLKLSTESLDSLDSSMAVTLKNLGQFCIIKISLKGKATNMG